MILIGMTGRTQGVRFSRNPPTTAMSDQAAPAPSAVETSMSNVHPKKCIVTSCGLPPAKPAELNARKDRRVARRGDRRGVRADDLQRRLDRLHRLGQAGGFVAGLDTELEFHLDLAGLGVGGDGHGHVQHDLPREGFDDLRRAGVVDRTSFGLGVLHLAERQAVRAQTTAVRSVGIRNL